MNDCRHKLLERPEAASSFLVWENSCKEAGFRQEKRAPLWASPESPISVDASVSTSEGWPILSTQPQHDFSVHPEMFCVSSGKI